MRWRNRSNRPFSLIFHLALVSVFQPAVSVSSASTASADSSRESVLMFGVGTSVYFQHEVMGSKISTRRNYDFAESFQWQKWWFRLLATEISLTPEPLLPQLGIVVLARVPWDKSQPSLGLGYHAAIAHRPGRFGGSSQGYMFQSDWMASAEGSVFLSPRIRLWLAARYLRGGVIFPGVQRPYRGFPWGQYVVGYELFVAHLLVGIGVVLP